MKYRIWCVNRKEWEKDIVAVYPNGDILHVAVSRCKKLLGFIKTENHIIQYSTDMWDKNKKEAFTGDIIKFKVNGEECIKEVEYFDGGFQPLCFLSFNGIKEFEIVGNIFENPLLYRKIK